jgi:hypothetical protein
MTRKWKNPRQPGGCHGWMVLEMILNFESAGQLRFDLIQAAAIGLPLFV